MIRSWRDRAVAVPVHGPKPAVTARVSLAVYVRNHREPRRRDHVMHEHCRPRRIAYVDAKLARPETKAQIAWLAPVQPRIALVNAQHLSHSAFGRLVELDISVNRTKRGKI